MKNKYYIPIDVQWIASAFFTFMLAMIVVTCLMFLAKIIGMNSIQYWLCFLFTMPLYDKIRTWFKKKGI